MLCIEICVSSIIVFHPFKYSQSTTPPLYPVILPRTAPFFPGSQHRVCANAVQHSPFRSLLVEHAMTTLLATDGVSSLQWDFRVAVTAQVIDGGAIAGQAGLEGISTGGWDSSRNLIGLARHDDFLCKIKSEFCCVVCVKSRG